MSNKYDKPFLLTGKQGLRDLMPSYAAIPDEFKSGHTKWNDAFSQWFFNGINKDTIVCKDGIDKDTAIKHLRSIMSSWIPKHEHKEAACAYLMSLWFTDIKLKV